MSITYNDIINIDKSSFDYVDLYYKIKVTAAKPIIDTQMNIINGVDADKVTHFKPAVFYKVSSDILHWLHANDLLSLDPADVIFVNEKGDEINYSKIASSTDKQPADDSGKIKPKK